MNQSGCEFPVKSRWKQTACFVPFIFIVAMLLISYQKAYIIPKDFSTFAKSQHFPENLSFANITEQNIALQDGFGKVNFDINGSDVIVFLHIQKTGGTSFGRKLVSNIILAKECDILLGQKKRNCMRPNSETETWIFSRYSTGWLCGLHADWTALNKCVPEKMSVLEKNSKERRFFYITILRDPVKRFISEWRHVQRGATWKTTEFICDGKIYDIPKCFLGDHWYDVPIDKFTSCRYNMGRNRQTRMLADLELVECYKLWLEKDLSTEKIKELENRMLESAMKNLKDMTFFGLVEEQEKVQALFEYTFPFKFKDKFITLNETIASSTADSQQLNDKELEEIERINHLDVKLYAYARELFLERYKNNIKEEEDAEIL